MRTGACTVQQALTAEAASVLKHSLNLARRRGHAQVTPLHVAATLMSSSSSSSYSSSNLLRRACLKSQPHHAASHPLQCRALELCFNVALNRLPTIPPPSSGSLLHPQPSLSNALIAALKRAQAHQRRGCIELQQQQQPPPPPPPQELQHPQQQQPLLAIKVELEQLILSILDDPSVSRVMREAGFSSTCVKSNLEEETSVFSQSSPFLLEARKDFIVQGSSIWQNHFFKLPSEQIQSPAAQSSFKEDVKLVLELMLRKQGRRTNAVVVGDSASMTEGLVAELVGRVDRGDVPDELKSVQFINLQISYVHLRLMNKTDVDMKVSDLRRKICSLTSDRTGGGVIIYAGNLGWAVDEEARGDCGFKPVEHMVAEMERLLSEFRGAIGNGGGAESNSKVWLLATASFQTYMRCQMRQPSLESRWALQAVTVPSSGLALSLQASSGLDSRIAKMSHNPVQLFEPKVAFNLKEEEKFHCCSDCASGFEREASALKPGATQTSNTSVPLPPWLQPNKPRNLQEEDDASKELRRKWSRLCQSLHQDRHRVNPLCPSMFNQSPPQTWWSGSLQAAQSKDITETHPTPFSTIKSELGSGFSCVILSDKCNWPEKREPAKRWLPESTSHSLTLTARQQVGTALTLGSSLYSDSATSKDQTRNVAADLREVGRRLQENIPWQSEAIPSIVEALQDLRTSGKKGGAWLLIHGSDHVAKRRMALVMAESLCGSTKKLFRTSPKTCGVTIGEALANDPKCVFLIEGIDGVHIDSVKALVDGLKDSLGKDASLADAIFILAISRSPKPEDANVQWCNDGVLRIKLQVEGEPSTTDLKRKQPEEEPQSGSKKRRTGEDVLDLNLMAAAADDDDEEPVPSDLTHEAGCGHLHLLPQELLESAVQFTLEADEERSRHMTEGIVSKLRRWFDEASRDAGKDLSLVVDRTAMEEVAESSGLFLESQLEGWAREVLREGLCSLTVEKGGSVRLVAEGKEGNMREFGFMGSVLPSRVHHL